MKSQRNTAVVIRVRAVLFDMDGVLISSTGADERSWTRWAQFHGMEGTFRIHSTHGRRTIDTVRALRPDLDEAAELDRIEAYDAEDRDGLAVLPGVLDLLIKLSPLRWSIVTSASERLARHRLGLLGVSLPAKLVTAEMVSLGKPHPEPYLLGARQLGLAPADCLVIEDSPNGIRAGKLAGCPVLAVATSHARAELIEADWIVDSLTTVQVDQSEDAWMNFHVA